MDVAEGHIGRRVREVRSWRRLSLTAAAELAGISPSYLSLIERGLRPVTKRATLESLAQALRVSPVELTGKPDAAANSETHAAIPAITDALSGWWIGEIPDAPARAWDEISADLARLYQHRATSNYAAQAALVPGLIRDLLATVADPTHRREALIGLIGTYYSGGMIGGRLGFHGMPALGVEQMHKAAEELGDPAWSGIAAWARAHMMSGANRARQYQLAVAVADTADARPEVRGMGNLTAALAAAAQGQEDTAQTHLVEAASHAESIDADVSEWSGNVNLQFGRTNVGIWRVAIGVELGHGAQVAEIASTVHPETINRSRQCAFWLDYGRGLIAERKTQERGLAALVRAEKLAPQQVRTNPFAREAVTGLLTTSRRAAGGRELRALATRIGINPAG